MSTALKAPCGALLALVLLCSAASAQICLDTIFASNNNGSPGGAVYFNVVVAPAGGIRVLTLQTNTNATGSFSLTVYTAPVSHVGIEAQMGMWTMVSTGMGTGAGVGGRSMVDVADFDLPMGTNGIALVISAAGSHYYTNGTGANQSYPDANITINLGSAMNVPFSGAAFTPRVWNGQICYRLNDVTGVINSPAPAAMVGGAVNINFDADQAASLPLIATFEFSTDSGVTFPPCTAAPGFANPMVGIATPATGVNFDWNSAADGVGLVVPEPATIRLTLNDGTTSIMLTVDVIVDNVVPPPTCTLALATASPATREIPFDLNTATPSGSGSVDALFEFSLDGGLTFMTATADAASSNPLIGVPSATPTSFVWDSRADSVGQASIETNVQLRATLTDAAAPLPGTCVTAIFSVDNTALCQATCGDCDLNSVASTIVDALTSAQFSAGIGTPTMVQLGCCDVDSSMTIAIVDSLIMAQISAGLPIASMCP